MNLPFYQTKNRFRLEPKERHLMQKQALINDRWDNSTQNSFNVLKQKEIGSKEFLAEDISVDYAIDIGTGFKKGDDFKVFSYRQMDIETPSGLLFKFAEDYWITINTRDLASPTNSIEVRRCNNVLKWIDPNSGTVLEEPCVVEYDLSGTQPQKDKDIIVANGHISVIVQGNEQLKKIDKNQRFILNGQAFKVVSEQNLLNNYSNAKKSTLIYMDLYFDTFQKDDDLINNIANVDMWKYKIQINPNHLSQVQGHTGELKIDVFLNDEVVNRELSFDGVNAEVYRDGTYRLTGQVGEIATIRVSLKDNPQIYDMINIQIVNELEDNYEIILSPDFTELRQGIPQEFSVFLCNNGERTDASIDIIPLNLDGSYFDLIQENNYCKIINHKISSIPLKLKFSSRDVSLTKEIELKTLF